MTDDERMPRPAPSRQPAAPEPEAGPAPEPEPGAPEPAPTAEPTAGAEAGAGAEPTAQAEPAPQAEPAALAKPAAQAQPAPKTEPAAQVEAAAPAEPRPTASVAPAPPRASVEPPSPDVALAQEASPLPGSHRGGFLRLPTAPVAVTVESAPQEPGGEFTPDATAWRAEDEPALHRGLAAWALAFAVLGLLVSLFVGWGFLIGIVAVVSAIIALRRPLESRAVAVWAISLGTLSILYSAGWLLFAAFRSNLFT